MTSEVKVLRQTLEALRDFVESGGRAEAIIEDALATPPSIEQANLAELCEVLGEVSELADAIYIEPSCAVANSQEIINIASKALYKSPRNCDVGTAEEQRTRFDTFCKSHFDGYTCGTCPLRDNQEGCEFYWGQLPYNYKEK